MKIAVSADAHLRTRASHPERYNALENIMEQAVAARIENLIIAGDLFDKDFQNYSEFEDLCRRYPALRLHIIPGNHDPNISGKSIAGDNIRIYTEPTILEMGSVKFLLLPYEEQAKMGEAIARMESVIDGMQWVLVGHGDFFGGVKEPNPLEPGTYMPLSKRDLGEFKPAAVLLGHIHKPYSPAANVHYVGSPCGLDISETGRRSFLVYDTADGNIETRFIETDVLYFTASFLIVPRDNEAALLKEEIARRVESWTIDPSHHSKVRVRVEAKGYATDRNAVLKELESGFQGFKYFKGEGPRIDQLSVSSDDQLQAIADRTMKLISELDWSFGGDEPTREQVETAALSVIYED
jgi:DNA repair exonuclease SbcCD nuclease subunit